MHIQHKLLLIVKTTTPDYAKEALALKAHQAGCTPADYLRDLVFMDLYGETFGEHVANSRRSVLGFKASDAVQLRACE